MSKLIFLKSTRVAGIVGVMNTLAAIVLGTIVMVLMALQNSPSLVLPITLIFLNLGLGVNNLFSGRFKRIKNSRTS